MIMNMKGILSILMLTLSLTGVAQLRVGYDTDSARIAEYRERIGLDYSMPDYSTSNIDDMVCDSWNWQKKNPERYK